MGNNVLKEDAKEKDVEGGGSKPIMIYPDGELRKKLVKLAEDESRSASNMVTYILKEYFKSLENG